MYTITKEPEIVWDCEYTVPMKLAAERLCRDVRMVLETAAASPDDRKNPGSRIEITREIGLSAEKYVMEVSETHIRLRAADELGIIYALLFLSERFMGILPFWYWNDCPPKRKEKILIPCGTYEAPEARIRFRGWFINDEVLLDVWNIPESWEMAFEALLRLGGNIVIPGTDRNSRHYKKLASDMGLWITHHHAEPLGAEMFLRAYPDRNPSFAENPELFRGLWRDAVKEQQGQKTVWNLGFRGQGDRPFWADDPQYDTPAGRGALIGSLIGEQYAMVKEADAGAVCCTNLYGEIMELYRQGFLTLPEDVIHVWADNGYGSMVSRRQGCHNPRVPALPEQERGGRHGIYYHASFYDLQAAFHITMLPNPPQWVEAQLEEAYGRGAEQFLIVNASNVRPHCYTLHTIARTWGYAGDYLKQYYGELAAEAAGLYGKYYGAMLSFGSHEDEKAGEQFYHYTTRALCHGLMASGGRQTEEDLVWLTGEVPFAKQVSLLEELLSGGLEKMALLEEDCERHRDAMPPLFSDSLYIQAVIHHRSCLAELMLCRACRLAERQRYEEAFENAGDAAAQLHRILEAMREAEHGKWKDFYANECLTDVKFTLYMLEGVMRYIRNLGDGPHFYRWARKYMGEKQDEQVVLITNMRNHPRDKELYRAMKGGAADAVCGSDF